ncbi:trimethyltridecatetraene synthase-like [Miscanthus floridulus]|uniref:trimethyltridecatetraene synthase-like n=1 Tax=Miscanthus floridulus TaxID=154761 RepID=UPI003458B315
MELPPWSSLLGVVLFLVAVLLRRRCSTSSSRKYTVPPGPRPWPVIGNLNLIGPLPHRSMHERSARYGPLMSLRFGSYPSFVGSSVDMAKFFLKTHDLALQKPPAGVLDRPALPSARYILYNSDVLWASYGPYWRQGRKLFQNELLSAGQMKSTEHIRIEEVRCILRAMSAAASRNGGAVVPKDHLSMASFNIASRMALGKKYIFDGSGSLMPPESFRWMIQEFFLNGVFNVGDVIPWLSFLDPQGYIKRMKRLSKMFDPFLEHVLVEHSEQRRRQGDGFVPRDMVDQLLQLADDASLDVPIERDGIKAFILDIIAAGSDTTAVAIEWALSELLRKPETMAKATDELDRVVGGDRLVTEADIPRLPYLEAVVKETMRVHPLAPLLTPRLSREDTSVGGYGIPAGTEFLPFGSGRRMCPGLGLGMKMVHLMLANLLQAFVWRLPDGVGVDDLILEGKFGLSMPRMVPLEAVPEPKLPAHLYDGP